MEYMSAADPEHIAFACLAELLFDISDTVDRIGSHPLEWHSRGYRACDHSRRKLWFGRKARVGGHVGGFQTIWIVGPFLWKIQRAIDERMAMTRNVAKTPIWQVVILPAEPVYCGATPHDALPCLRKPVSSITRTASSSAKCSMT